MKERKSCHIHMLVEPSLIERVDEWGFTNRIRSRADAIRQLVNVGLKTKGAAGTAIPPRHEYAETREGNSND